MGGTIRRVFSAVLIALMIMPSAWVAYAEDTPEDNIESAPVQTEQAQPEPAEKSQPEASEPAAQVSEPEAAEPEVTPGAAGASSGNSITIGDTKLDGSSDGSGEGWTYDKENQVIVLKDFNKKTDIKADGTGAAIVTTGLCNIGTLKCDGQIDVTGTGVMLIDNIELAEGCDFNLHSIAEFYGEDGGSVAVFLLQEDGTYRLMNGGVTGIIDEEITLPEGTTLVLPENSKLNVTGMRIDIADDEPLYYYGKLTVDNLVIDQGSSIIQSGAVVKGLEVVQNIVNNGLISGKLVDIYGDYSGSGLIDDAKITVSKGQEMSIRIKDSNLVLNGSYVIDRIASSGSSKFCYDEDTVVKNIEISDGDGLDIYSKKWLGGCTKLTLTDTVDGGDVFFGSGVVNIEEQLKLQNGAKFLYTYPDGRFTGAIVFDYRGSDAASLGIDGPVFMGPKDIVPDQEGAPTVYLDIEERGYNNGLELGTGRKESTEQGHYCASYPFYAEYVEKDGIITHQDVIDYYSYSIDYTRELPDVEVIRYVDGRFSVTVMTPYNGASVPADNIVLVRISDYTYKEVLPGGALTSSMASRTGSATVGGNANSIFTGTSKKTETSQETKPEENAPSDTVDRPNNAKRKASVRAQSGNTDSALRLVVDVFDLNAGKEGAEEALYYVLSAYRDRAALSELSAPAEVLMDYELPVEFRGKQLYAVFAEEDAASGEMLKAYRAEYDEETGQLSFETAQLGEFVIAALDFDGEEYSPEFYDELEKAKEVQPLIRLIKE